mmetsp:Transcript_7227/g.14461  ORF Transcript_7227/g.14461 Transcript_7227/m.14461 type:complete len:200 (+) Transcript_7227:817-1416(+)
MDRSVIHTYSTSLLGRSEGLASNDLLDPGRVALRVTSHGDAEKVASLLANVPNEVKCTGETGINRLEVLLADRRVSTESKDVADAGLLGLSKGNVNLLAGHVSAGEVHVRNETKSLLGLIGKLKGKVRGTTASTPGEVRIERSELLHAFEALVQVGHALLRAWGIVLKCNPRLIALSGDEVRDLGRRGGHLNVCKFLKL